MRIYACPHSRSRSESLNRENRPPRTEISVPNDVGTRQVFLYLPDVDNVSINTELNDLRIRQVFIPFFGLIIPNATGMIENSQYSWWELWLCYGYFMFISFTIWEGNRYLLFRLRPRFSWLNRPGRKIIALIISNVFYTIPITVGLVVLWYAFARHSATDWDVILKATALCVVCVVFITHTYETVFLIRSWENDRTKSERLEKERMRAELDALKSQIDPHFIFNSLNTLSHFIEQDPAKAKLFNDFLADVYRYILSNKDRDLVLLREELAFLDGYVRMLQLRFGASLRLITEIPSARLDQVLLPPISLQILVENAIKHNEFSDQFPLNIFIRLGEETIEVKHSARLRRTRKPSSGLGLRNLSERYKVVTDRNIAIDRTGGQFTVSLPVVGLTT